MRDKAPHGNFPFACRPDCSVYRAEGDHSRLKLDSSLVEFSIEFKTSLDHNPFTLKPILSESDPLENPFMSTSSHGVQTAGQITAYASFALSAQYRTHLFLILIIKDFAKLIRWDRGGAVVTEPIYFNKGSH